jgi:hypothetical protein
MKSYLALIFVSLWSLQALSAQNDPGSIALQENYQDMPFTNFTQQVEERYGIQFFFFAGWVADLSMKQERTPMSLDEVMEASLEGTPYGYFIHPSAQVILTNGSSISATLNWRLPGQVDSTQTEVFQPPSLNLEEQLAGFETEWFVIGDPALPEQKPQVILSGQVFSQESGKSLEGVVVYVEELERGTITDSAGFYQLSMPQGRYQLVFQSVGLKEKVQKLQLYASGQMDVELGALVVNIEEVVMRANVKESVRGVELGVEALTTETIRELPTLMGEVDIVRSALLLPGVQSAGEFSSGFNVRGGSADQNLVLLNGAPVFNPSHLFGFTSSFSSDVVAGFELYKSSIPAKYGGRISSVLEVDMKEGNMEDWSLSGGISPVTGRLTLEGPIVKDKTSLIISGRSTYADWILDRIEDASIRNSRANYFDGTIRLSSQVGEKGQFDVSAYLSDDDFQLNGDTAFAYQNRNLAAHYRHGYSQKLYGTYSGIYSQYRFQVSSDEQPVNGFDLGYQIDYLEGRAHFSYAPSDKHQVNFGTNLVKYQLQPGEIFPNNPESIIAPEQLQTEDAIEASIYLSDEWTISDAFSASVGLRYTRYFFLGPQSVNTYRQDAARTEDNRTGVINYGNNELVQDYGGLDYRLSLRYALDANTSIKAAVNRSRQYLSMLFNSATVSPTATWKLSDPHIRPQVGNQYALGLFRNLWDDQVELSLEGYFKQIDDMVDYKAGAELLLNENLETELVNGEGQAYGVEFLVKKTGRKLNGWASYTYSRTRFRSLSEYPEDQINQGDWFPTNFDQPHNLSLVANFKISRRFSLSSNVSYSTGRPVTVPVAKYQFADGVRLQYSRRNEFRVPDYFRWDLSVNLEGSHKQKKLAHSSWSLSLYNVTGRQNVYSVYFVSDGTEARGYQLSIFGRPFLTLTYNFKI